MNRPRLQGGTAFGGGGSIPTSQIMEAWASMEKAWDDYTELVSSAKLMQTLDEQFVEISDIIQIKIDDVKTKTVISRLLKELGKTVITEDEELIFQK